MLKTPLHKRAPICLRSEGERLSIEAANKFDMNVATCGKS